MFAASRILEQLAECLCTTIGAAAEADQVPDVCFCGIVPGDQAAMDYMDGCDNKSGMAWVRGGNLYPATGINVVNETVNNDGASIGMDIEVGIARRIPQMSGFESLPTADEYRGASRLQMDDALLMFKAIRCCFYDEGNDAIVGTYDPFGPLGGVAGGTISLAVLLD